MVSFRTTSFLIPLLIFIGSVSSCGRSGDGDDSSGDSKCCLGHQDIRGSIVSSSGGPADLQNWTLLLIERDSGVARSSLIDQGGLFLFRSVDMEMAYTLALVSSELRLHAVMAMPSDIPGTVRTSFKLRQRYIGNVVHSGQTLSLQNLEEFAIEPDLALDTDGDGVPDGAIQLGSITTTEGTPYDCPYDPRSIDIDCDGILNIFDHDDDGDGVIDLADRDANGDGVMDEGIPDGDLFFKKGVDWVTTQYELVPQDDGTRKAYLSFKTQLTDEFAPFGVQLVGPPLLLNGANIEATDNTGLPIDLAWNRRLEDDGFSSDVYAGDLIYGKKVRLPFPSLAPTKNDVFLFQLLFPPEENPWNLTYVVSMPEISVGAITAAFTPATRTVTKFGTPFGAISDYTWSISLFNGDNQLVWGTGAIPGSSNSTTLPQSQLKSGSSYKISISARLLDKVTGFHTFIIHSPKISVTAQ